MPYFILLSTLTEKGRRTLIDRPGRIWEVNKEIEEMGAKVLTQYSLIGPYDFINILEAPNNQVMSRVAASLGARGTMVPFCMAAIPIEDFVKEMSMAKAMQRPRK
jgi:uncharacterized protein with GYD domain